MERFRELMLKPSSSGLERLVLLSDSVLDALREEAQLKDQLERVVRDTREMEENPSYGDSNCDPHELQAELLGFYHEKDELTRESTDLANKLKAEEASRAGLVAEIDEIEKEIEQMKREIENKGTIRNECEMKHHRLEKELVQSVEDKRMTKENYERLQFEYSEYEKQLQASEEYIRSQEGKCLHIPLKNHLLSKPMHSKGITAVVFGQNYESFITASEDKTICRWSLPLLTQMSSVSIPSVPNSIHLNTDTNNLAISCTDKSLIILNMDTSRILTTLKSHTDICTDNLWLSQHQVITTSKDHTAKIFDLPKNSVTTTIQIISGGYSICRTFDPSVFAVGCADGKIKLIDIRTRKISKTIDKVHTKQITSVVSSITGDVVYSLSLDNTIGITNIELGQKIGTLTHPELNITNRYSKLSLSPCGGFLCAGSSNGSVIMFDLQDTKEFYVLRTSDIKGSVNCSVFASNMLITADSGKVVSFWT